MWIVTLPVGVVLAALPRRYWRDLDARWPVFRMAWVSGLVTMAAGAVIGVFGYFAYITPMADVGGQIMMKGGVEAGLAAHALAIVTVLGFAFFTPTGLFSTYLIGSGVIRAIAGFNDLDGAGGDPLLTWADAGVRRLKQRVRQNARQRARERLEGPAVADVVVTGEATGLRDADLVVVASRRKAGWERGVIVVTADHWYRLGKPMDKRFPEGLRTMYPLTRLKTVEVLRKYVTYELGAIEEGSSQA